MPCAATRRGAFDQVSDPGREGLMSTAGKVLAILVMLVIVVWVVLASGVARLNTNANTKLHDLQTEVERLDGEVTKTQLEVTSLIDSTSEVRTQIDVTFAVLRARQYDIEQARSQILENLLSLQFQLATAQETVKSAQTALDNRNADLQAETKALALGRSSVQELITETDQLSARLATLRKDFQTTYRSNLEILGKVGRSADGERGRTN
jgi:outer membrane protein TolC